MKRVDLPVKPKFQVQERRETVTPKLINNPPQIGRSQVMPGKMSTIGGNARLARCAVDEPEPGPAWVYALSETKLTSINNGRSSDAPPKSFLFNQATSFANRSASTLPPESTMTTFLPLGIDAAGEQRGKADGAAGLDHQLQFAIGEGDRRCRLLRR